MVLWCVVLFYIYQEKMTVEHFHKGQFYRITSIIIYIYSNTYLFPLAAVPSHSSAVRLRFIFIFLPFVTSIYLGLSVLMLNAFESFPKFDNNNMAFILFLRLLHVISFYFQQIDEVRPNKAYNGKKLDQKEKKQNRNERWINIFENVWNIY